MTEVYRSNDGRYSIMRVVDRYEVYLEDGEEPEEVWSGVSLAQLYQWMAANGLSVADFDEV